MRKLIEINKLSKQNNFPVIVEKHALLHTFPHIRDPNIMMTAKRLDEARRQNKLMTRETTFSSSARLIALQQLKQISGM